MITNCASAGASSSTNSVTGVVTRPDPITKQPAPASIQLNGGQSEPPVTNAAAGSSLSSSALSAILSFQP